MELRSQTSLVASVLCFALAATVLFRPRKRRVHWLFLLFDSTVGAWYLSWFLAYESSFRPLFERLNLVFAVALPLAAVQFFRAFLAQESKRSVQLNRVAVGLALGMIVAVFTPLYPSVGLGTLIVLYVAVLLGSALALVYRVGRRATSRFDGERLGFLAGSGAVATVFTLAEYLPYVGVNIPPVGTVLMLVFLFVLSQSILKDRLLDLYELAGRLTVLTALSFSLAGILWILVFADPGNFYLHSVVAALVLLLVFDPVRQQVERRITQIIFRQRFDFEQMATELKQRLANVLTKAELVRAFVGAFEGSRRISHASIFFLDDEHLSFEMKGHVGPAPASRIEVATARPLLERLSRDEVVVLESIERELEEKRELGDTRDAHELSEIVSILQQLHASVCVAIRGDAETYGLIGVLDERRRDAFSPEEVQLLRALGGAASVTVENARLYERLKERDRLAALGEMSAGLAHEIRNPLGAIKASAQFLAEGGDGPGREFLDIIVEEVDRLNRVVSSFLDYARPGAAGGAAEPIDVNATTERTLQLLGPQLGPNIEHALELASGLPTVRIDAERLRQVLINLALNAVQAMEGKGRLVVRTLTRGTRGAGDAAVARWVEIHVVDTGPGIPATIRENLFVPFVTTKERGTGLGLAISQRIVSAAGGMIEVRSSATRGTTFVVRLPAEPGPASSALDTGPKPSFDQGISSAPGIAQPSSGSVALPPEAPGSTGGSGDGRDATGAGDTASRLASIR
jgi:two-component system sensor histidine kinase HydH